MIRRCSLHSPVGGRGAVFLLAGGPGGDRRAVADALRMIVRTAGLKGAPVAYIGAANGDSPRFREWVTGMLLDAGAGRVAPAPLCGRNAAPAAARRAVTSAGAVFVSGGDVESGMLELSASGMAGTLRELHQRGIPFIGLSAGSIMLCRAWVRWRDPADETTAEKFECLGFAPILCDTHGEDDDWAELKALLMLCREGDDGYGIATGGTMAIGRDGRPAVMAGEVERFVRIGGSVRGEGVLKAGQGGS
ncbi:MAG: hypothetical protein FJ224_10155 [Lentisphaerae bacterium]|nr:hypothetical protein [Lentisphaerota bacterium]